MRSIHFILPDYTQFVSGGNWYNQQLINALQQQAEWNTHVWTFETFYHKYQNIEIGLFIVDTLYLDQMKNLLTDKKEGQKFHLLVHHLQSLYPPKGYTSKEWFNEKERNLLELFDGFITTSQYTADYLRRQRMKQPIEVIPPALSSLPQQIPLRQSRPIKALLAANVIERKGILPFLEILQDQIIDPSLFSLEIAGDLTMDKSYVGKCLEVVETTHLKAYCRFLGPLSPQTMEDKYRTANLLIATSFFETYGMTLQEAVVWKLPILALRGGNTAYHIQNGRNGYLFDDIKDLIDRLNTLIKNQEWMDLLLKQTLNRGEEEAYTWEDAVEKFSRILL